MGNIQRASALLREHLAPWLGTGDDTPEDEFDCCAEALAEAGLLAPDPVRYNTFGVIDTMIDLYGGRRP